MTEKYEAIISILDEKMLKAIQRDLEAPDILFDNVEQVQDQVIWTIDYELSKPGINVLGKTDDDVTAEKELLKLYTENPDNPDITKLTKDILDKILNSRTSKIISRYHDMFVEGTTKEGNFVPVDEQKQLNEFSNPVQWGERTRKDLLDDKKSKSYNEDYIDNNIISTYWRDYANFQNSQRNRLVNDLSNINYELIRLKKQRTSTPEEKLIVLKDIIAHNLPLTSSITSSGISLTAARQKISMISVVATEFSGKVGVSLHSFASENNDDVNMRNVGQVSIDEYFVAPSYLNAKGRAVLGLLGSETTDADDSWRDLTQSIKINISKSFNKFIEFDEAIILVDQFISKYCSLSNRNSKDPSNAESIVKTFDDIIEQVVKSKGLKDDKAEAEKHNLNRLSKTMILQAIYRDIENAERSFQKSGSTLYINLLKDLVANDYETFLHFLSLAVIAQIKANPFEWPMRPIMNGDDPQYRFSDSRVRNMLMSATCSLNDKPVTLSSANYVTLLTTFGVSWNSIELGSYITHGDKFIPMGPGIITVTGLGDAGKSLFANLNFLSDFKGRDKQPYVLNLGEPNLANNQVSMSVISSALNEAITSMPHGTFLVMDSIRLLALLGHIGVGKGGISKEVSTLITYINNICLKNGITLVVIMNPMENDNPVLTNMFHTFKAVSSSSILLKTLNVTGKQFTFDMIISTRIGYTYNVSDDDVYNRADKSVVMSFGDKTSNVNFADFFSNKETVEIENLETLRSKLLEELNDTKYNSLASEKYDIDDKRKIMEVSDVEQEQKDFFISFGGDDD